tara:strand:+ start:1029 stop:1493 length:465 start_codon:yes stop_codon:yes gene_type:complete
MSSWSILQSFAMGVQVGTPLARAVLTRVPEGLIVRRPIHSSSVEQLAQEALATAMTAALIAVLSAMTAVAMLIAMATLFVEHPETATKRPGAIIGDAALYDLVEFSAIKPNTATLRAIVNLYALALAHHEVDPTIRAQQPFVFLTLNHDKLLLL